MPSRIPPSLGPEACISHLPRFGSESIFVIFVLSPAALAHRRGRSWQSSSARAFSDSAVPPWQPFSIPCVPSIPWFESSFSRSNPIRVIREGGSNPLFSAHERLQLYHFHCKDSRVASSKSLSYDKACSVGRRIGLRVRERGRGTAHLQTHPIERSVLVRRGQFRRSEQRWTERSHLRALVV